MNDVDQERQKFEQWLRAQPHVLNVGFNKGTQEYILSEDQDQWIGWRARVELSLKAEARIEELEEALKGLLNEAHTATKPLHNHSEWSIKAQKVLENK